VDEATGVCLGERVGDLDGKLNRASHIHRAARHLGTQRDPSKKFEYEVEATVVLSDVEERCDIRMG
jgi:hypothetical protein